MFVGDSSLLNMYMLFRKDCKGLRLPPFSVHYGLISLQSAFLQSISLLTLSMVCIAILGPEAFIAARNALRHVEGVLLIADELNGFAQTLEGSSCTKFFVRLVSTLNLRMRST